MPDFNEIDFIDVQELQSAGQNIVNSYVVDDGMISFKCEEHGEHSNSVKVLAYATVDDPEVEKFLIFSIEGWAQFVNYAKSLQSLDN